MEQKVMGRAGTGGVGWHDGDDSREGAMATRIIFHHYAIDAKGKANYLLCFLCLLCVESDSLELCSPGWL